MEEGLQISELTEYSNASDDDVLIIVDTENSITKKITLSNLLKNTKQYNYHLELTADVEDNSQLEIPAYYKVGANVLEVYFMGTLLRKDEHYLEVGETGEISNLIQINNWGDTIDSGLSFDFIIKGSYEED